MHGQHRLQVNTTDKGLEAIIFTAEVRIISVIFAFGPLKPLLVLVSFKFFLNCLKGDMRNALNSLQATHAGFAVVNDSNVFKVWNNIGKSVLYCLLSSLNFLYAYMKVCDQPHPVKINNMLDSCCKGDIPTAYSLLCELDRGLYFLVQKIFDRFLVVTNTNIFGYVEGYAASDVINNLFKVTKFSDKLSERTKVQFIRVCVLT